jgi:uncharacterized protein DUF1189
MDVAPEPAPTAENSARSGFLGELGWFYSGAVLPMGSLSFYRRAAQRSVGLAVLFFFLFTAVVTVISTINIGVSMAGFAQNIHKEYQQGNIPNITISGGIAQVTGPQPVILANEKTSDGAIFVAIDTTGQITAIDTSQYTQGFLLTRTDLQVLDSSRGVQRVPLSQLNQMFSTDPLVINEASVANAWDILTAISAALVLIGLFLWNSVVRLMFIATLALIAWGIGSLIRPKIGFGPFIVTGLYAVVPALYLAHLFGRSGVTFFGLQTLLWVAFWIAGLIAALSQAKFFTVDVAPRLWTALIGLPMLILLIVDVFAKFPSPAGPIALWAVSLLTGIALVAVRLYFHLQDMKKAVPETVPETPLPPAA